MTTEMYATVNALKKLLFVGYSVTGREWQAADGSSLGRYFQGHLDGLAYASPGAATEHRIYELARQIGFVPVHGRVHVLAQGYYDTFDACMDEVRNG